MACKLTPTGHSPHVPLRVIQEGYPQLGLRELVYSDQLMKRWLEVLPTTTILDVGRRDLLDDAERGDRYHRYVLRAIGALEENARGLLRTPADKLYWRHHMDLHHKYIVVSPGMVKGCGSALQRLAEHEPSLLANNILTCSAYRHIVGGVREDPWTMRPVENATLNLAVHEAIWRVHCPGRHTIEYRSRERLENYAHASYLTKPHYFCVYRLIQEPEEKTRGPRTAGS